MDKETAIGYAVVGVTALYTGFLIGVVFFACDLKKNMGDKRYYALCQEFGYARN